MNIEYEYIQRKTVQLNPEETKSAVKEWLNSMDIIVSDDFSIKFFGSGECTLSIDYRVPQSKTNKGE